MAGPLTIQRVPRGLLHALSMKGSGELPAELASQILGTFDTTAFYLGENVRGASGALQTAADGWVTSGSLTVPAGELWLVNNLSWSCSNIAAGDSFSFTPGYLRKTTQGVLGFSEAKASVVGGAAGTQDQVNGLWFNRWLIAYPADTFGGTFFNGTYAGNPTITMTADYHRLEI